MRRHFDPGRQARCTGSAHHLFFSDDATELRRAQQVCVGCAVRGPCLRFAVEEGIEFGVWGGVVFWDGLAFERKRGRGRPRRGEEGPGAALSIAELNDRLRSA